MGESITRMGKNELGFGWNDRIIKIFNYEWHEFTRMKYGDMGG
jgi:hypothetical protein